jgi:hypothetical protein
MGEANNQREVRIQNILDLVHGCSSWVSIANAETFRRSSEIRYGYRKRTKYEEGQKHLREEDT